MKIYNTLTGKKTIIKTSKNKLNLFVCGPTVYDYSHIGHARNYIVFDALVKYLRKTGVKVFYLQNITDLDDKIIARAKEKDVPPQNLAVAFEKEYLKDMKSLSIDSVDKYARATSHIKEIISQISRLQKSGFAYVIDKDGVYYDISKFKKYGKLSGRTAIQAEDAVSRIDYSSGKRNRGDFCLWKLKQEETEPNWPSPWGRGRPGWHIEDTAITEKYFGSQYDIHGGARDLIFPHHEAEIAQMEAISKKEPFVKYWMHVGFLTINGQKMSKSLGNFVTINDFIKRHSGRQLRLFVLRNLWRSPIDYTESGMIEVKAMAQKIEEFIRKIDTIAKSDNKVSDKKIISELKKNKKEFYDNLADDFNTPKALAEIFNLIKTGNGLIDKGLISSQSSKKILDFFKEVNDIFNIIDFEAGTKVIPDEIKKMALTREDFRKKGEWQKADQIRADMEKQGFLIEDGKNGPIIKKQ